jgi:hypothetical protein
VNEVEFRNWLASKGMKKKVQSDTVSRLKRVEKEINRCDIDEHYRNDRCEYLLSLFTNMGKNEEMERFPDANLPIGKYYMSTFRHALKKYVEFCDETI